MEKKNYGTPIIITFDKLFNMLTCEENKNFLLRYYGIFPIVNEQSNPIGSKVKPLCNRNPIPVGDVAKYYNKKKIGRGAPKGNPIRLKHSFD